MNAGTPAFAASIVEMPAGAVPSPADPATCQTRPRRGLRLRAVGAHDVDVQLRQHPAELRDAVAADRVLGVDAKDAVFVAVECHRLAVRLQVVLGRAEVIERGLGGDDRSRINRLVASSTNASRYTSRRDPRTSGVRNCRSVPVRPDIHAVVAADAGRAVCGGDGPIALPPSSIAVASRHRSADHDVKSVFPPPVWVRSRCNVRAPGSAPWPGGSRHACDCSVGRVCATPDRPGHPQKTPGGGGRLTPTQPINVAAASTVSRSSARSIITRSRVSSRSRIWITRAIKRHLERSGGSVPQRHFYPGRV